MYDYLAVEPCCLVGPRHKFSCKRLVQKQQRLRSVGVGWIHEPREVGGGGDERVELRVWSLQEWGRFMTPAGILVARLQVRLDGYVTYSNFLCSHSRTPLSHSFFPSFVV